MVETTSPAFADAAATWNQRFSAEGYLFGTEPNRYLREHAARWASGSRLLCVADGDGRNSVWLAQRGMAVDAFDISEVGVRKAELLARAANVAVRYDVSDCEDWRWPQDHYGVVAIFVQFADPTMRGRLFPQMIEALRPGGLLVLQGFTPTQLDYKTGGPPRVSHLYTADLLRREFAAIDVLDLREYEDDLAEGTQHRGRSTPPTARKRLTVPRDNFSKQPRPYACRGRACLAQAE